MSQCLYHRHLTPATSYTSNAPPSISTKYAIDPLDVHLFRHRCLPPPLSPRFYLLSIRVALTLFCRHVQPPSGHRRYNLLAGHRPPFHSILNKPQRSNGINKSWFLLKLQHQTISAPLLDSLLVNSLSYMDAMWLEVLEQPRKYILLVSYLLNELNDQTLNMDIYMADDCFVFT
uniref:Uncharacterized protein n=1 Tax=Lactuca sativa TaxID=4236 RepID=A0A9R1V5Y6_LACSA|nr:hypothetical protein LSAT_V11C600318380 [Lactuca sativa]